MLSIAQSRYTIPTQLLFLALNGVGVFLVTIYNASTPDLYPNNAHHKLGWILTWVLCAQVVLGIVNTYVGRKKEGFVPVSSEAMEEHMRLHNEMRRPQIYRLSNDSGQGTEPNTESLRSQSISSQGSDRQLQDVTLENFEEDEQEEKHGLMHGTKVDKFFATKLHGILSTRMLRLLRFVYNAIDRVVLILSFVALTTGGITYGGFFVSTCLFVTIHNLTV
jgi:hypothetical protein